MDPVISFNKSNYLKDLRRHTLGMRSDGGQPWCAVLGNDAVITSTQARVQSNLACQLRKGTLDGIRVDKDDYIHENYLCTFSFHIFHDGKSFQLKMWGEFWGNTPTKHFRIDFSSEAVQADLAAAEKAFCAAWEPFGIGATIGKNIGHNPENIGWNATVPFKNYEELVTSPFSQHLRSSLTAVANAFASLLPYRINVGEKVGSKQDPHKDEKTNDEPSSQKRGAVDASMSEEKNGAPQYLTTFRDTTLKMRKCTNMWMTDLDDGYFLTSSPTQIGKCLRTRLILGQASDSEITGVFLAEMEWEIFIDGHIPKLKISGRFRLNNNKGNGIDFNEYQKQVEAAEAELRFGLSEEIAII